MVEFHPCNVVFAFGTFNHNQMQGKGCSHVLTCTREASRLHSSICLHGTKSNQHSCALKTIRISIICFEASMCFQIISNIHWYKRLTLNVFWRPKPNLLTMVEITTRPQISFQGERPVTIPQELVFEDVRAQPADCSLLL